MRKQPQLRGNCWRKAPGIINWWMNWCRSLAILCCRSRATAVSSIHRWTAFCAAVEYAIWFSPVSLPTSASNRRYAMAFSGVFRRGAGRRDAPGGAGICTESRVVQYRNLLAGSATSKRSATRFLRILCSYRLRSLNDAKIRNSSRWQQRTAGPSFPARWLMAWCMSPVRWLLINIITCCLPMTQRRKPATFWKLSAR